MFVSCRFVKYFSHLFLFLRDYLEMSHLKKRKCFFKRWYSNIILPWPSVYFTADSSFSLLSLCTRSLHWWNIINKDKSKPFLFSIVSFSEMFSSPISLPVSSAVWGKDRVFAKVRVDTPPKRPIDFLSDDLQQVFSESAETNWERAPSTMEETSEDEYFSSVETLFLMQTRLSGSELLNWTFWSSSSVIEWNHRKFSRDARSWRWRRW